MILVHRLTYSWDRRARRKVARWHLFDDRSKFPADPSQGQRAIGCRTLYGNTSGVMQDTIPRALRAVSSSCAACERTRTAWEKNGAPR